MKKEVERRVQELLKSENTRWKREKDPEEKGDHRRERVTGSDKRNEGSLH